MAEGFTDLPQASDGLASEEVVRAAGGLVIRRDIQDRRLVALVHRPRYDDWTFPKGKLQAGESHEGTALREVEEETGLRCHLGRDLGDVRYRDPQGRPKVVRYWVMRADGGTFHPNEEVDLLRWVEIDQADVLLSYPHDREILARFLRTAGDASVYLVRHAKAGSRSGWTEDDRLRPLSKVGLRQANGLVKAFRGLEVRRVISSPYVRCVQTVRPLALDRGLPLETSEVLAEGAPRDRALSLLEETTHDDVVLCTHGDIVSAVVLHQAERGAEIMGERDWKKGSVWVLERRDGEVVRARYGMEPRD